MAAPVAVCAVAVSRGLRASANNDLLSPAASKNQCDEAGDEEEHTVHDPEHPRSLKHSARLIGINIYSSTRRNAAQSSQVQRRCAVFPSNLRAIRIRNSPQRINTPNKSAHEKNIHEPDKAAVLFGAVVGEERADGPDDGEDGDNKEDKDGVWG